MATHVLRIQHALGQGREKTVLWQASPAHTGDAPPHNRTQLSYESHRSNLYIDRLYSMLTPHGAGKLRDERCFAAPLHDSSLHANDAVVFADIWAAGLRGQRHKPQIYLPVLRHTISSTYRWHGGGDDGPSRCAACAGEGLLRRDCHVACKIPEAFFVKRPRAEDFVSAESRESSETGRKRDSERGIEVDKRKRPNDQKHQGY